MRKLCIAVLASATFLAGCNTVRGVGEDIGSVADAFDPTITYPVCGSHGLIDRDKDGRISRAEWAGFGSAAFGSWDTNGNGVITRAEFANCWYGGGFAATYNQASWQPAFESLDLNGDGLITPDEFFSVAAWARLDPANTGYISAWPWN